MNVGFVDILMARTTGLHPNVIDTIMQIFVRGSFDCLLSRRIANYQEESQQYKGEIYNSILHLCKIDIFEGLNRIEAANLGLRFGNWTIKMYMKLRFSMIFGLFLYSMRHLDLV